MSLLLLLLLHLPSVNLLLRWAATSRDGEMTVKTARSTMLIYWRITVCVTKGRSSTCGEEPLKPHLLFSLFFVAEIPCSIIHVTVGGAAGQVYYLMTQKQQRRKDSTSVNPTLPTPTPLQPLTPPLLFFFSFLLVLQALQPPGSARGCRAELRCFLTPRNTGNAKPPALLMGCSSPRSSFCYLADLCLSVGLFFFKKIKKMFMY